MVQNAIVKKIISDGVAEVSLLRQMEFMIQIIIKQNNKN